MEKALGLCISKWFSVLLFETLGDFPPVFTIENLMGGKALGPPLGLGLRSFSLLD